MPIYDYKCPICGKVEEVIETKGESEIHHICKKCGAVMKRLFPTGRTSFKLLYDPKKDKVGWGSDSYSSTQRYRNVKK